MTDLFLGSPWRLCPSDLRDLQCGEPELDGLGNAAHMDEAEGGSHRDEPGVGASSQLGQEEKASSEEAEERREILHSRWLGQGVGEKEEWETKE